jgi:hypothetical protein
MKIRVGQVDVWGRVWGMESSGSWRGNTTFGSHLQLYLLSQPFLLITSLHLTSAFLMRPSYSTRPPCHRRHRRRRHCLHPHPP